MHESVNRALTEEVGNQHGFLKSEGADDNS